MSESVIGQERIFMSVDRKKRVVFDSNVIVYALIIAAAEAAQRDT